MPSKRFQELSQELERQHQNEVRNNEQYQQALQHTAQNRGSRTTGSSIAPKRPVHNNETGGARSVLQASKANRRKQTLERAKTATGMLDATLPGGSLKTDLRASKTINSGSDLVAAGTGGNAGIEIAKSTKRMLDQTQPFSSATEKDRLEAEAAQASEYQREQARLDVQQRAVLAAGLQPMERKQGVGVGGDAGEEEPGFLERVGRTVLSGLKGSTASNANTMATAYEAGQAGRNTMNEELLDQYWNELTQYSRELANMQMANQKNPGSFSQAEIELQEDIIRQAQTKYNAMRDTVKENVQQKATQAAYQSVDELQASAASDSEKAKQGLGKFGQMLVDAGASGTQMALDMATNAALGTRGSLAPMASRSFGGGAQQARQEGASLGEQIAYGGAVAAKEMLTEKIFNVALPFSEAYGGGAVDDLIHGAIENTVERLAKTDLGKNLLRGALNVGASGVTEGLEELVGAWAEWQMPRIYGGDVATVQQAAEESLYNTLVGALSGIGGGMVGETVSGVTRAAYSAPEQQTIAEDAKPPQSVQTAQQTAQSSGEASSQPTQESATQGSWGPEKVDITNYELDTPERLAAEAHNYVLGQAGIALNDQGADRILSTTENRQAFERLTGKTIAGDLAQQRQIVKDGILELESQMQGDERGTAAQLDTSHAGIPTEVGYKGDTAAPSFNASQTGDAVNQDSSVGAARYGFEPYSNAMNQYGAIEPGERPARVVDVPKSIDGRSKVTEAVRTVMEAAATPENRLDSIQNAVVAGDFSFLPKTNAELEAAATTKIERDGWDAALNDWTAEVRAGKVSDQLMATGAVLLNNAGNSNVDSRSYVNLVTDYAMLSSNAGKALQAARVLKTLTPEGKLYGVLRSVGSINEQLKGKYNVQVDETLIDSYRNATDDAARDAALNDIMQNVADQIPSSPLDKWTALRYLNMLGNFRTQVRNVAGNVGMQPVRIVKDRLAAGMESIAYVLSGGKFERTKSFLVSPAMYRAAWNDFSNVQNAAMGDSKYQDGASATFAREIQDKRTIFKNNGTWGTNPDSNIAAKAARGVTDVGWKVLEGYRNLTNAAMDKGDVVFSRFTYADALAQYLTAHKVTAQDYANGTISAELMDKARAHAIQEAQEATYRDTNAVSRSISQLGRNGNRVLKVISEGILPFRKTPANILVRAEEYSPLGLINTAVKSVQAANPKSSVKGSDVINSLAKSLTGTGLLLVGYIAAGSGIVRGKDDDDDKQASFDTLRGHQEYSLEVGGKSYTLDWLAPEALPFFMGVQFADLTAQDGLTPEAVLSALGSISDPMINMSMLSGVNDTLENIRYSDNSVAGLLFNISLSYMTQGITSTLLGQIERSGEQNRQMTYVDQNSLMPDFMQRALGSISAKTPGWDYNQVDYIDAWGRKQNKGGTAERVGNNLFNPSYTSQISYDEVEDELQRLYNETGRNVLPQSAEKSFEVNGQTIQLTPEQWEEYATSKGDTAYDTVSAAMQLDAYQLLDDGMKAGLMEDLYAYSTAYAKGLVSDYDGADSWVRNLIEENATPEDVAAYAVNRQFESSFCDALDSAVGGNESGIARMDDIYSAYEEMDASSRSVIREQIGGNFDKFIEARRDGISSEQYAQVKSMYDEISGKEEISATQKATEFASALDRETSLTNTQKSVMMEAMAYYSFVRAEPTAYNRMKNAGVSSEDADKIVMTVFQRGASTDAEKYMAINAANGVSDSVRYQAALGLFGENDDSARAKITAAEDYGIPFDTLARYYSAKEYYRTDLGVQVNSKAEYQELINGLGIDDIEVKRALWLVGDLSHKPSTSPYGSSNASWELYNYLQANKAVSPYS